MEEQLILATIVQKFSVTLDPEQVIGYAPRITLAPEHGMRMKIKAREFEEGNRPISHTNQQIQPA